MDFIVSNRSYFEHLTYLTLIFQWILLRWSKGPYLNEPYFNGPIHDLTFALIITMMIQLYCAMDWTYIESS